MAIAGGINLTLDESKYEVLTRANLLGSGQESRSFGDGNGLIPGEGVGAVLLKPLAMALRDGDPIHAVIKSSAANHSGGRQMYTAPDPKQQARLMEDSLRLADIDPATIGYVESAANGSALGDSIEVIALQQAFARFTDKKQFCALGSIKSNLGHLEAASGISQLTKVVLQLKHGTLVPTIHATPINPNIKLKNTAFYLQETGEPWKQIQDPGSGRDLPRRSMINSFGAGGAYTNLIVEEYMGESLSNARGLVTSPQEFLIVFSAKTKWSLLKYLEKIRIFLREKASMDMNVLAQSLQKLNHGLDVRAAFVTSSARELAEQLDGFLESPSSSPAHGVYTTLDQQPPSAFVEAAEIRAALAGKELRYLAQRWTEGAAIDFEPLYGDQSSSWMELPHYAFDHGLVFRFEEDTAERGDREVAAAISCDYDDPYLKGHKVNGDRVLVGAVLASLAVEAFFHKFEGHNEACIRKLHYLEPVKVKENQITELEAVTFPQESSNEFQIVYRRSLAEEWKITGAGQFQTSAAELSGIRKDISGIQGMLDPVPSLTSIYERGKDIVQWGELFRTLTQLYASPTELLARIVLKPDLQVEAYDYILNPLITNSAYLAMLYLVEHTGVEGSFVPFGIHEIQVVKNKSFDNGWLHIKLTKNSGEMLVFDVEAVNENGETVVRYLGYSLKRTALRHVIPPVQDAFLPSDNFNQQDHVYQGIINYLVDKLTRSANSPVISDLEANLMELGLDSASLLALTREIESDTGIELYPTLFFEYPSLRELADFFSTHHRESFIPLFEHASMPPKLVFPERKMTMMPQPAKSHSETAQRHEHEGIAIVGMSGQFAGCENVAMFWEKQIEERAVTRGLDEEETERVRGSRIKKSEELDYTLFGISEEEASLLDRQQYCLLTQAWKAIEDAGIIPQTLSAKSTGVFIALGITEPHSAAGPESRSPQIDAPASRMSNTLSYIFNLRGPCESYEADASSFFVALNRAVQAIRGKECEQALVGDVQLESENTGVILLKPLQHAIEEGDPVYAVIQGTAVIHGGRGPSFHAFSPTGMADAVKSAYQITGLNPRTTGYIEAHGWNPLSEDAAQLKALEAGYRQLVSKNTSNLQEDVPRYVGMMTPISAMASFVKVVLALQHGIIPGTSGVSPGSASKAVEDTSFLFREESLPWQNSKNVDGGSIKRRADLNHSSPDGMNACVVLEEYVPSLPKPKSAADERGRSAQIVILSAKTKEQLHESARQMIAYSQRPSRAALSDAAYTLQVGRAAMEYRLSLVVTTWEELVQGLLEYLESVSTSDELRSSLPMYEGHPMDDPTGFRSLLGGNLGETVYRTLYEECDYAKLALCWAQGGEVSWQKLRKGENLNKIHMPTYPFERSESLEQAPEKKRRVKTATSPPAGESVLDRPNAYPELLPLNRKVEGQPVFWLHGGLGSVEMYKAVAGKSDRPFYGIQARGYINNRSPIKGIEKMASYYIEIIRSVQAKGPYDLGGFSLGGMLAYEITRQLQLAKEQVRTIVMIDSPFSPLFKENKPSTKTLILQTINTMLASVAKNPKKMTETLINRNEVNMNAKDEEFLDEMIRLARSRGLSKTEAQIRSHIKKNIRMQRAYEFEEYSASPLPRPEEVSCYYLRNKSGIFLGSLEPFLTIEEDKVALDQTNYWGEWQRHIPEFQLTDVEASNHMLMMMEPKAMSVITKFCEEIYSNAEAQVSLTTR
ncbi:Polyketide synthase PksR [compost metagenome]